MLNLNELPLPRLFEALTSDGSLDRVLEAARAEDLAAAGDVTTMCMVGDGHEVRATGLAGVAGILCGMAVLPRVLSAFGCAAHLEPLVADGSFITEGQTLWRLSGQLSPILTAERTLLNVVGRLSGIASLTGRFVERVAGTKAVICDTRKTTPGLRSLEKYAVRCGGGILHRLGLFDAVLFKDNHLAHLAPGELAPAITRAAEQARARFDLRFVEVEADTLEQLRLLLGCPTGVIDIILLDNMPPQRMREAVAMRDADAPGVLLEASGGIGLDEVRTVAETGVDRISVGALTHSAASLDVGLHVS